MKMDHLHSLSQACTRHRFIVSKTSDDILSIINIQKYTQRNTNQYPSGLTCSHTLFQPLNKLFEHLSNKPFAFQIQLNDGIESNVLINLCHYELEHLFDRKTIRKQFYHGHTLTFHYYDRLYDVNGGCQL